MNSHPLTTVIFRIRLHGLMASSPASWRSWRGTAQIVEEMTLGEALGRSTIPRVLSIFWGAINHQFRWAVLFYQHYINYTWTINKLCNYIYIVMCVLCLSICNSGWWSSMTDGYQRGESTKEYCSYSSQPVWHQCGINKITTCSWNINVCFHYYRSKRCLCKSFGSFGC